jgi:hypothetical protein
VKAWPFLTCSIKGKCVKALKVFFLMVIPIFFGISCVHIPAEERYPDMVADTDPIKLGMVEAEFDKIFSSGLSKQELSVIFYPRYDMVAVEFKFETIRYRQFWNRENRETFIKALERYKEDYTVRNLDNRYRKTKSIYGKLTGLTEWETFGFTNVYSASPVIEIGYRFRQNAPYFAVFQRSAKEETGIMGDGANLTSTDINMYYTRSQAEDLIAYFNQDFLVSLVDNTVRHVKSDPIIDIY